MYYNYSGGVNSKDRLAYSYLTISQFLKLEREGKDIADFFYTYDYKTIAIYGAGELGILLYSKIKNSSIKIPYFIDKSHEMFKDGIDNIPVIGLNDISNQNPVDVIVVTPVFYFNQILDDLLLTGCTLEKIISLNAVVFGVKSKESI